MKTIIRWAEHRRDRRKGRPDLPVTGKTDTLTVTPPLGPDGNWEVTPAGAGEWVSTEEGIRRKAAAGDPWALQVLDHWRRNPQERPRPIGPPC